MSSSSSSIAPEEGDAVRVNVSRLPGFRFCPSDELLVSYYLKNKIEGTDSHFRHVIPEIDVWKFEPCDIPAFFPEVHEKEWFFFTRPKYKDTNSTRRDRLTHKGYYKITGDERVIRAEESKAVIGKKIILTFHEGRAPKAKKSDWVIHEYYCTKTEVGSKPTKQMDLVLCRLKNRSPSYKKPKGDPTRGESPDSGANPEDDQAAASDVIAGPVEHLGCKEIGDVNSSESQDGSCPINWKDILTFVYGDDETGGWKVSDVDDPAASDMFEEFCSALEEIPNSTSQLPQPPQLLQAPEPHQPPHPHQTQDYCPSTHQPPEYIISTNDPNEPVSKPNGVQDLATDEIIPEDCFHPDEFMGLLFDPSQDYLLPSPMNMELGDGVHPNNCIGCTD
ncbi:NAC domain-containing protein 60-like [Pyrus x bretschneideri]|uniref:NAC domain-containing protein 60-like n=1 Tax=Pyrus x bretschneideri TaxID=225117 RepID=UPI002030A7C6|nr:NAC domain-containing protein 60-like [Pyrus x bretschneideri]